MFNGRGKGVRKRNAVKKGLFLLFSPLMGWMYTAFVWKKYGGYFLEFIDWCIGFHFAIPGRLSLPLTIIYSETSMLPYIPKTPLKHSLQRNRWDKGKRDLSLSLSSTSYFPPVISVTSLSFISLVSVLTSLSLLFHPLCLFLFPFSLPSLSLSHTYTHSSLLFPLFSHFSSPYLRFLFIIPLPLFFFVSLSHLSLSHSSLLCLLFLYSHSIIPFYIYPTLFRNLVSLFSIPLSPFFLYPLSLSLSPLSLVFSVSLFLFPGPHSLASVCLSRFTTTAD